VATQAQSRPNGSREIRFPRWTYGVALLATLFAGALLYTIVFVGLGDNLPLRESDRFTSALGLGLWVAALVIAFLTVVFGSRFVRPPRILLITKDGFEYAPAGVSFGFIKWNEVRELRDETVQTNVASIRGLRPVTAVVLRDGEAFQQRFNGTARLLFQGRVARNSSPILIPKGEFGRDHDNVITKMREMVAGAKKSPQPSS
jgi:hypothetical protein